MLGGSLEALKEESLANNNDILLLPMMDDYTNLTLKVCKYMLDYINHLVCTISKYIFYNY